MDISWRMICWSFLLLCVHSNSIRTTDSYSWSHQKHLGATLFKWQSQDLQWYLTWWVRLTSEWTRLKNVCTAKSMYYRGTFLPLLLQSIKQEKMKGILSQTYQRLIGDKRASAGDCQYSLIFPLPYNAWLLTYLVKGELLISTPL